MYLGHPATSRRPHSRTLLDSGELFAQRLLHLGRVFLEGLLDHIVELALNLGKVALVLAGYASPDERACAGIAKVNHQRAFGIRDTHVPCTQPVPPGGIGLDLRSAGRTKSVAYVEIGGAGGNFGE